MLGRSCGGYRQVQMVGELLDQLRVTAGGIKIVLLQMKTEDVCH